MTTLSDDDSEPDTDDELDAVHNSEEYTNMVEEIKLLLEDIAADEFKHLTPGSTIQHAIRLIDPNTKPFRQKMRKVPYSKRDEFYQLIKEQLDANIIAASSSPWSSPVLLVAKPDGSIRLTIDYRWLNDITEKDAHPLPNMECLYTELEKSKYFTKIDCFSGFYQVKLEESSRKYTAFACEWGLGQEVSEGIIRPSMDRIQALFDYQRPTTLKQLQSFLGLAGHYRKYITMFAEKAHPLYDLLKQHDVTVKNTKISITWNDAAEKSFNELRDILTTRPLLRLPNFELLFILDTDACNYAVGAVLSQEEDKKVLPVGYFSKHLTLPQRNYSTSEKELLAIVLAAEHFGQYL